jgi:prolyl-tRNA synthetase
MRPRLFLRTTEFLWQEGHTAHATESEAVEETLKMLEVYRAFAEDWLAMPVIAGEKPENERFPGAVNTYSIEAMMQDGKALQAGTSHFLGTHFAEAQNIRFQNDSGGMEFCHTTSWGVSTRLIGGVIMTHGDDDGLRLPPAIAPKQIVVVPMLRDKPEDADVLKYCEVLVEALNKMTAFGQPLRAHLDAKKIKSAEKRWNWVRRGAPLIVEVGPRDASGNNVTVMRRDELRDGDKVKSYAKPRQDFLEGAVQLLTEIQAGLFAEAKARLDGNIKGGVTDWKGVEDYFAGSDEEFKGWLRVSWSRPTGAALDAVDNKLKTLKLTIRNAPLNQPESFAPCLFTGKPGVEEILIGRAY